MATFERRSGARVVAKRRRLIMRREMGGDCGCHERWCWLAAMQGEEEDATLVGWLRVYRRGREDGN